MLTREFYNVASEKDVKVRSLEGQLFDARQRLQGYEKIEKQLDDIVMESAQSMYSLQARTCCSIKNSPFHCSGAFL